MSTTKKHREFVREPIGDKPVTDLPGVGPVIGERLQRAGFGRADNVLGQYLVQNQDREGFTRWMNQTASANTKQAGDCYTALQTWSEQNLK